MRLEADWLRTPLLKRVVAALEAAGGEARIAGGAVRDGLCGLPVSDIDIATTLVPNEVEQACNQAGLAFHPTGIDHGTVTVVGREDNAMLAVEVTTLRKDVDTDGRRAVVAFTKDWRQDAMRRDFTINALYADLEGRVYDPWGEGVDDLEAGRVRFVGDARERIREDYLRILRFFRFHARFAKGEIDAEALQACRELKAGIAKLSGERVRREMFAILELPQAVMAVQAMDDAHIFQEAFGVAPDEPSLMRLMAIEKGLGRPADVLLRFLVAVRGETGLENRLRFSNEEKKRYRTGRDRMTISPGTGKAERRATIYARGTLLVGEAVLLNWVYSGADPEDDDWRELLNYVETWEVPAFPVAGRDLVALGFERGPEMGRILRQLEKRWIDSNFSMAKEELLVSVQGI